MNKVFINNLYYLRQLNIVVAALAFSFAFFPLIIERNNSKAMYYLVTALVAIFFSLFVNHKKNQQHKNKNISKRLIYLLIVFYYANIIFFGIYLGVWANPGKLAVSFMGILICALLLFNLPSLFNLCLTLVALSIFIVSTINVKVISDWSMDVTNALFASVIGLFVCWRITVYRLTLALTTIKLEDENTVDALTQLKNRRDFTQTIQRCLSNYRSADDFLCLGILDIDLFKNYNDYYGHPQGDECLRIIGKALASIKNNVNLYAARIGGEEFALIWFEKDAANISSVASKINQAIRDLNIKHARSSVAPYVTISIGIHYAKCGVFNSMQSIYDLADKALYAAKTAGRDRAIITSS